MKKNKFLQSKAFKILLPFAAVLLMVALFQNGYQFGKWLYAVLH